MLLKETNNRIDEMKIIEFMSSKFKFKCEDAKLFKSFNSK